jgi:hypothetical protein
MWWLVLQALTNRWIWLFALLAGALLVVVGVSWPLALGAGALVLGGGAVAQGAADWRAAKRARGIGAGAASPAALDATVRDRDAAALLRRARMAATAVRERNDAVAGGNGPGPGTVPGDVTAGVGVAVDRMIETMASTGRQVDRLVAAHARIDAPSAQAELQTVLASLQREPDADPSLVAERRRTAEGLQALLATERRLRDQRLLLLERMRATAVGVEGVAVRLGELAVMAADESAHDVGDTELAAVTTELEDLRQSLVAADEQVRRLLG